MSEFSFFRCDEVRCPLCGEKLTFLKISKLYRPMLVEHPKANCELSERKFYATPLVVDLEEFND